MKPYLRSSLLPEINLICVGHIQNGHKKELSQVLQNLWRYGVDIILGEVVIRWSTVNTEG